MRYVVRPAGIRKTPQHLATVFGCQTRRYPTLLKVQFSLERDFFCTYPKPEYYDASSPRETTARLYAFWSGTKLHQRSFISATGLPIPDTNGTSGFNRNSLAGVPATGDPETSGENGASGTSSQLADRGTNPQSDTHPVEEFIVRPLRHSKGSGYRLTTRGDDFTPGQEYIQRVFPKDREYRIIYVRGRECIVLRKKNPNKIPANQPWNFANGSTFMTLKEPSRLHGTDCFKKLSDNWIIQNSSIVAVDVLLDKEQNYVICEFNACPSLLIDGNLQKVCEYALASKS